MTETDRNEGLPVGVRLNQLPADGGGAPAGGQQRLASTPAAKRAAARAIEDHIEPDTKTAGDWADEDTSTAVKEFGPKDGHGWDTATALKSAHKTWGEQVNNLMHRLSAEKSSLRSANNILQGTDAGVRTQVRSSSSLDGF
ncbi:hypothetical protein OKJ48_36415 [Streptomyces kunmingensis]|uniref:Excreted virulence factor EspC, type VII ESX diderm n=1 Tax=Streptomyces kunmingensis TaxID=68225 RepID=A0ABU6CLZ2_9ACTN|nr:hypothetical protein [Streptomyces kunmingensis]MEB3965667.1 hypothetical protein [Streptomyces kunmingensis]